MAAGHLLALDRERMGHALALIPNMCTYRTRAGELSMWKGCAGPNGARNGILGCAGLLTNAYERSMQRYRSNGSLARLETSGGSVVG
jgi:hypothetical protein